MDEPQFIPKNSIFVDNERPKNAERIRPRSRLPLEINKDEATIKVWFMPAVPIYSVELTTADNVDSVKWFYVTPEPNKSKRPIPVSISLTIVSCIVMFINRWIS